MQTQSALFGLIVGREQKKTFKYVIKWISHGLGLNMIFKRLACTLTAY